MPSTLDLNLTIHADYPSMTARFHLQDAAGQPIASTAVDFNRLSGSEQRSLFDLRDHLRHYVDEGRQAAEVEAVGVRIAQQVLGEALFGWLWQADTPRALHIQFADALLAENHLAAALARVPWELARPAAGLPTLAERGVQVHIGLTAAGASAGMAPLCPLAEGEPLRVLFVCAEARGAQPLGARQERLALLELFEREIYPKHKVVAHFLTHGVTSGRLAAQIEGCKGYHIVHWSGHGKLEGCKDFSQLPGLFAAKPGDMQELAYLDDALAVSIDQLIGHSSPDARLLLWMVAVANEPVKSRLLDAVWQGNEARDADRDDLRWLKDFLDMLPRLPKETQAEILAKLPALHPEVRARLDALPAKSAIRPKITHLLRYLATVGLAAEQWDGPKDANPDIACHELVRERIRAWMAMHAVERGGLTENTVRLAYADWLVMYLEAMQHKNLATALQAGSRALLYCVQADAYDKLNGFAGVITGSGSPRLLKDLLPHLRSAAEAAPPGRSRWACLCHLADALRRGGQPEASLPFYRQAAGQARAVAEAGGEDAILAWSDLGAIYCGAANAHAQTGALDAAGQYQLDSAEALRQADRPTIDIIGRELEALRIAIQ